MKSRLEKATDDYAKARQRYRMARNALRAELLAETARGAPEATLAREAGISRNTLRLWKVSAPEDVSPAGL